MKPFGFAVLFLSLVSLGSGCRKETHRYPVPPTDARAGSVVLESRSFEIGAERFAADFGSITVPEHRGRLSSRLIHIPFLRIHSQASRPLEPIFGLGGGPGQSNVSWDWGKIQLLLQEHDFIAVGYRGVDGSTVLDCPEVEDALRTSDDPLSEESVAHVGEAFRKSALRFQSAGIDLDGYSMLECIDDQESVCKALEYTRIDILSESYGTRVAYLYALRYPDRILRSAMLAVNPPGHFAWDAATTDAQLRHYADLWARDPVMSSRSPDLYAAMRKVLTSMPRRWLIFPINPGKVRVTAFALLFQRKTAAMVFDAFVAADQGDPSGIALMSLAYDYVVPSLMVWGDLASKAVSADYDPRRNAEADAASPATPLGSPMSRLLWGPQRYAQWPTSQLPAEFRTLRPSEVPTLLVSGSIDFSTPGIFATKELLPFLHNGTQIILSECGHVNDLWSTGAIDIHPVLAAFFRTGTVDASALPYVPMDFHVSWGFPTIAKTALATVVLLGIILVAGATVAGKKIISGARRKRKH